MGRDGHDVWPLVDGIRRRAGFAGTLGVSVLLSCAAIAGLIAGNVGLLDANLPYFAAALGLYFLAVHVLSAARLAGIATLALLLHLTWTLGLAALAQIALTPYVLSVAAVIGAIAALMFAQFLFDTAADIGLEMEVDAAASASWQRRIRAGAAGFLVVLSMLAVRLPFDGGAVLPLLGTVAAALLAFVPLYLFVLPLFLKSIAANEAILADLNRRREARDRLLHLSSVFAVPRWSYAGIGIILVLSAVFFFDGGHAIDAGNGAVLPVWRNVGWGLVLALAAAAVAAAAVTDDWRAAPVAFVLPFLFASWGAWLGIQLELAEPESLAAMLAIAVAFAAAGTVFSLASVTLHRRFGDEVETAFARAAAEEIPPMLAALPILVAALGLASDDIAALLAAVLVGAVSVAGICLAVPALITVIDDIVPRHRSLEELYGPG